MKVAAALEQGSEHPLAAAIVEGATARGLAVPAITAFTGRPGKGIEGTIDGARVALGNVALMRDAQIALGSTIDRAEALRRDGQTVVFVAIDGRLAGLIGVVDPIKAASSEALRALHAEGLRVVMLTGDNQTTAAAVAAKLGIDDVRAEVLPDEKRNIIRQLQRAGHVVAMAGDGVNDAPALAEAAVGIAMGTGTDVAIESAGGNQWVIADTRDILDDAFGIVGEC